MPKRRSLVGTGREAIGETPAVRPAAPTPAKKTPAKRRHAAPESRVEAAREEIAAAAPSPPRAEHGRSAPPSASNAYEAMMTFASAALRQNLETGMRLAQCKSPMDVLTLQAAHATAMTQSFIAISMKMMQLSLFPGSRPKA